MDIPWVNGFKQLAEAFSIQTRQECAQVAAYKPLVKVPRPLKY